MIALGSIAQATRYREALEPAFQVRHVRTWDALDIVARECRPCAFFIGTIAPGAFDLGALARLVAQHGPEAIILHTAIRRVVVELVGPARKLGVDTLVLEEFEDSKHRLRLVAEDVASRPLARALLARLPCALQTAELQIRDAIHQLAYFPRRFRVADDLAYAAKLSLRTLYRRFEELELATPRIVVIGARLLRAHWYMRVLRMFPASAANQLRYTSVVTLTRQCQQLFGMSPRAFSLRFTSDAVVDCIAALIGNAPSALDRGALEVSPR